MAHQYMPKKFHGLHKNPPAPPPTYFMYGPLWIYVYFLFAFYLKEKWKVLQSYLFPKKFQQTLKFRAYWYIVNVRWKVTVQMWHMNNRKRTFISLILELSLNFLFSVIIEKSKVMFQKLKCFPFLNFNPERYIFLKFLSNSKGSFMAHKSPI